MLPYDIIRHISLYLKPRELSINKELSVMYNDIWYQNKLQFNNPSLKLYTSTSYHDLYYKYLKQGMIIADITYYYTELSIKGIKAVLDTNCQGNYILTFNGDLYYEDIIETHLCDNQVIDIDINTYIKDYDWFIIRDKNDECKFWRMDVNPVAKFIKVINNGVYIYALTSMGVYYYSFDHTLIECYPICNAKDIYSDLSLYIIDDNDKIYTFEHNEYDDDKLIIHPTDENLVYKGTECFFSTCGLPLYATDLPANISIKYKPLQIGLDEFDLVTCTSFPDYFPANDKIYKHHKYGSEYVILSENNLYIYDIQYDIFMKLKTKLSNVIDICGNSDRWYVILK